MEKLIFSLSLNLLFVGDFLTTQILKLNQGREHLDKSPNVCKITFALHQLTESTFFYRAVNQETMESTSIDTCCTRKDFGVYHSFVETKTFYCPFDWPSATKANLKAIHVPMLHQ